MKVFILKKRKYFIEAAKEFKVVVNGIVLQAALNLSAVLQAALNLSAAQQKVCFVGYTATKKLGKAHIRNRTKRRLRAAAALVLPEKGLAGVNYVLIGRHNTTTLDFSYLTKKLKEAVEAINLQIIERKQKNDQADNDKND